MTRDVANHVKKCIKCQQAKTTKHTKTPLTITFDRVLVDTIGPLPKSERGNQYTVTLICDLTI